MFPAMIGLVGGIAPVVMAEGDVDIANAVSALTTLGVLPIITVVAVLTLATTIYKRFRK
jgi:cytochrome bd-type quinol oxidase subunit 2